MYPRGSCHVHVDVWERRGRGDAVLTMRLQITFLTEWQLYAQKVEGDAWKGDKLDGDVMEKMTGEFLTCSPSPSPHLSYRHRISCVLLPLC